MSYDGQYHPKLVTATIGNPAAALGALVQIPGLPFGATFPWTATGRAADNFYAITNATDMVSAAVGAEGNVSHVISHDESGTITITLKRGSPSNTVLSVLYRAQRLIGEGQLPPFTFPVTVRDNNASPPTTHAGFNCMILRQPDDTFGAGDGEIAWGFIPAQIVSNFNGRLF